MSTSYPPKSYDAASAPAEYLGSDDKEKTLQEIELGELDDKNKASQVNIRVNEPDDKTEGNKSDIEVVSSDKSQQFHRKRRIAKRICIGCCCFWVVVVIVLACIIPFLVQTPSISVGKVTPRCSDLSSCISGDLPLNVEILVDNPNIIGADVSANVAILRATDRTQIGEGKMDSANIAANGVTTTLASAVLWRNYTPSIFNELFIRQRNYTILLEGEATIYLGALHPTIDITESYTIPPNPFRLG